MSSSSLKHQLLSFCEARYEAIHLRNPDGEYIGRGIKLARNVIDATPLERNAALYLDRLKQALLEEKRRVLGTDDDDRYGWALGGIQTVVNEVEKQAGKKSST